MLSLTAAMMLDYLGFKNASIRLNQAIEQVYADGQTLTPDVGGRASTEAMCEAVRDAY